MTSSEGKPDILIVVVTDVEQEAVIDLFQTETGHKSIPIPKKKAAYINLGIVGEANVWMVISEMGSIGPRGSTLTIDNAIEEISPEVIIMVGIAFGVNSKEQNYGDILVSKKIVTYDQERVGVAETTPRYNYYQATSRLVSYFQTFSVDWPGAKVHFGTILSGEKLIDNIEFRDQLCKNVHETIGGEMEGAGLCSAAIGSRNHVDWILVKGICDFADGNKGEDKENRQLLAARNATSFVLHVLKRGIFPLKPELTKTPPKILYSQSKTAFNKKYLKTTVEKIQRYVTSSKYQLAVETAQKALNIIGDRFSHDDPATELLLEELRVSYAHAVIYAEGIDKSLPLLKEAINHLEECKRNHKYKDPKRGLTWARLNLVLGRAYNNLGYAHWMDRGHYEKALNELYRALECLKEGKWEQETATAYDNLGRIYAQLGYRTYAELLIEHGFKLRAKLGNDYRLALSLISCALVHLAYGQSHRAYLESEYALVVCKSCFDG
jgi:nucleoside phosphorylase